MWEKYCLKTEQQNLYYKNMEKVVSSILAVVTIFAFDLSS